MQDRIQDQVKREIHVYTEKRTTYTQEEKFQSGIKT